jgi:glycerol-3-phosphate dehydrogenase (NAD+)
MSAYEKGDVPEAPQRMKIAVIGAGAFGTAMAVLAARNSHDVSLYMRKPEVCAKINSEHKNPSAKTLESFELSPLIVATNSIAEACKDAAIILHALPAQTTPDFIRDNLAVIPADAIFCWTSKGLFLKKQCLLSEAISEAFGRSQPLAVLSGPSFAKQIVEGQPTAVVVASRLLYHAVSVQRALSGLTFRIYTSQDLTGVELGGALKNPLAIGAGIIEGKGLGINTLAFYLTRACHELQQLTIAMGGRAETVSGLSGIGDLMLTAFGDLSRNRTCGMRLARGDTLEMILADATVEGVPTADVAMEFIRKCGLEDQMPIFSTVHGLLKGTVAIDDVQGLLMSRPLVMEQGLR